MYYKIISVLQIEGDNDLWKEWKEFKCNEQKKKDLSIIIQGNTHWQYGLRIFDEQMRNIVLMDQNCLLSINESWNMARITLLNNCLSDAYKILNALLFTHLSMRKAIEVHASLVDFRDAGIMFLGPSGIGKTTQAELWMKYRGAEIINGDMVFVKHESDYFLGCGSPWHGSSPYCLNRQVPISALIVLKQSQQYSIRRLTGFEMVSTVLNSVFLPSWYQEGYKAACDTVDALLRTIPVYELSCRPDEDAVRLTEETVFSKGNIIL